MNAPRAFVLISFEADFEAVYTDLIKASLEEVGFVVERADSQLNQRSILQDIVRGIASADLIVADLTGMNPNVMYELGIAHALEVPTILLTQNIEELPFDLRAYRANEYSIHFNEAPKIQAALKGVGSGRIDGTLSFGSPVTDFMPPELRLDAGHRRTPRAPAGTGRMQETDTGQEEEEEEAEEDAGAWFDTLRAAAEANDRLVEAMERIGTATNEIGARVTKHTDDAERINASSDPTRVKQTSNLFIRVAHDLDRYADRLEAEVPVVEQNASANLNAMSEYLAWLQANPHLESGDEVQGLQESVSGLFSAAHDSLESTREFRETMNGLRGVSRPINSASKRVVKALDGLIAIIETVESQASRVLAASEEVLARGAHQLSPSSESDDVGETTGETPDGGASA